MEAVCHYRESSTCSACSLVTILTELPGSLVMHFLNCFPPEVVCCWVCLHFVAKHFSNTLLLCITIEHYKQFEFLAFLQKENSFICAVEWMTFTSQQCALWLYSNCNVIILTFSSDSFSHPLHNIKWESLSPAHDKRLQKLSEVAVITWTCGSSVGIVTRLQVGQSEINVSFMEEWRYFHHHIQTSCWAHWTYLMGTWSSFTKIKMAGVSKWPPFPLLSSTNVKNAWSCTSTPQFLFSA